MASEYYCEWRKSTESSRELVEILKGQRNVKLTPVVDIAKQRAEIMAELAKLPYSLPGVN